MMELSNDAETHQVASDTALKYVTTCTCIYMYNYIQLKYIVVWCRSTGQLTEGVCGIQQSSNAVLDKMSNTLTTWSNQVVWMGH